MHDREAQILTRLGIPGMDCPAEERMIRLALDGTRGIDALSFNPGNRELVIFHSPEADGFVDTLRSLGFSVDFIESRPVQPEDGPPSKSGEEELESRSLQILLAINGIMFLAEIITGIVAQSTGLIADSLDMLADASVYAISLFVVKRNTEQQVKAAHWSGWMQAALAFGVLIEVVRRLAFGSEPQSPLMIGFGVVALLANIVCLMLIYRHRKGGAHMQASWIFSANDVIANFGVILAGVLVALTGSNLPDLIIGAMIGVIVLLGARRILALRA